MGRRQHSQTGLRRLLAAEMERLSSFASTRVHRTAILELVALMVVLVAHGASALPCCAGDHHLRSGGACSDGAPPALNCSGTAKYVLEPARSPLDDFRVINGSLHVLSEGAVVPPIEFCTGQLDIGNGSDSVAVLCYKDLKEDSMISGARLQSYAVCLLVSVMFLLATLAVYSLLPNLRDLQGKCVISFVFSLAFAYFLLGCVQLEVWGQDLDETTSCVITAFSIYFWMMSAFFWLNINSFNIFKTVVMVNTHWTEAATWTWYCIIGWGGPLLLLLFTMLAHHLPGDHIKPKFGELSCWFGGASANWTFFLGPVAILQVCNCVYFVVTVKTLWRDYRGTRNVPTRIRSLRFKSSLYLKLFVIMGITWIFEVISYVDLESKFWYFTDLLNCLQGVIIFIVMIACRKRVLRGLAIRGFCGAYGRHKWHTIVDEESDCSIVAGANLETDSIQVQGSAC